MPGIVNLAKAEILELDATFKTEINTDKRTTVQFNPETLKVSLSNELSSRRGAGDQRGTASMQFLGAGTSRLAVQLWFDVTASNNSAGQVNDVRDLTKRVAYFITPREGLSNIPIPPAVGFQWGSFRFAGLMESLEESLEFFSDEGKPLRASVSFNLIRKFSFKELTAPGGLHNFQSVGTKPFVRAPAGSSLQKLVDSHSKGKDWQSVAAANGIENPRSLPPGQVVNINV